MYCGDGRARPRQPRSLPHPQTHWASLWPDALLGASSQPRDTVGAMGILLRIPLFQPCLLHEQKHRGSVETSAVISGLQRPPAHCCDRGPCGGPLLSSREWVGSTGVPGTQAGSSVVSRLPPVVPGRPRAAQVGQQLRVCDELRNGCSHQTEATLPSRVPSVTLGVGSLALTFRSEYNRQESAISETFKNPNLHL